MLRNIKMLLNFQPSYLPFPSLNGSQTQNQLAMRFLQPRGEDDKHAWRVVGAQQIFKKNQHMIKHIVAHYNLWKYYYLQNSSPPRRKSESALNNLLKSEALIKPTKK